MSPIFRMSAKIPIDELGDLPLERWRPEIGMFQVFAEWPANNKPNYRIDYGGIMEDGDRQDMPYRRVFPNRSDYRLCVYGSIPGEATIAFLFALETSPKLLEMMEEDSIIGRPIIHT